MGQDRYFTLVAHIRTHCQQVIQDAGQPSSDWRWCGEDQVGKYVREHKSFITLKKTAPGQVPSIAFPPATEQQLRVTEQQLGFSLPLLLRLLYTQIANGGFGPGYGITGAVGGYPFWDISLWGNIAEAYHQAVDEASKYRQSFLDHFLTLDPEEQKAREISGWVDALPSLWPEHFLPLCQWGCNISTYINADTEQIFQGMSGPDLLIAPSLEEWLERWLAGEELQFM